MHSKAYSFIPRPVRLHKRSRSKVGPKISSNGVLPCAGDTIYSRHEMRKLALMNKVREEKQKKNIPRPIPKNKKKRCASADRVDIYSVPNVETYGDISLKNLIQKEKVSQSRNPLQNHNIDTELRAKMIDWMIEVLSSFGMTQGTWFLAVAIFDKYCKDTDHMLGTEDVHLMGIVSMFLASKYEDIYPLFLEQV